MRAVVLRSYGGPEVLQLVDVPDPVPGPDDVLASVEATAVNRADTVQRLGRYAPPGPRPAHEIPGLEFAGVVEAVGERVRRWRAGDRVFGLLSGGGYAERVLTHERMLLPVPPGMTAEQAAAIPEVFFTAFDALFRQAGLSAGESVLVHAAASGVGTAAIQLAVDAGATAFGTTRSTVKAEQAARAGATMVVVGDDSADFASTVVAANGGRPVDVVLDLVGASYLARSLAALAPGGRLVVVGLVGGTRAEIDLGQLLNRRLHVIGTLLRPRPVEEKMALTAAFERVVLPRFASGRLHPVIDRVLPLAEAAEAHRLIEANAVVGKIVLRVR
jgi:NADPH2:quinone reductase